MAETLLILILLTNPLAQEDAEAFAKRLKEYTNVAVKIEVAKEADVSLAKMTGISSADLLAAGTIGKTLTKQKKVILIHVDRRSLSGDAVLEAKLWYDGRQESFVSIAGKDKDPLPGLVEGSTSMIGYLLRSNAVTKSGQARVSLAQLAKEKAWEQLLGRIAAISVNKRAPMDLYYQIMAYVNLGQRDAAVASLNDFRKKYKDHILVTSAESIIPPRARSDEELIDLGGGETMDPLFEGKENDLEIKEKGKDKKVDVDKQSSLDKSAINVTDPQISSEKNIVEVTDSEKVDFKPAEEVSVDGVKQGGEAEIKVLEPAEK